jgi:elongation factor P--(R)-beta-lysine ligase
VSMSLELSQMTPAIALLKDRAVMLKKARLFFEERGVLELDCPILNGSCNIDDFIDPIAVSYCENKKGFLHTSPELFMKKLLADGIEDIFFLGHVFRDHEKGGFHHVEFTMVEWYRLHLDFQGLIDETVDFVKLFFDVDSVTVLTYHQALLKYTSIDYTKMTKEELLQFIQNNLSIQGDLSDQTFSDLLTIIFTEKVEPHFNDLGLVVLKGYPKEQSALSKIEVIDGLEVAKRFELYYKGVELANGYDELIGGAELEKRFTSLNEKRAQRGKIKLPIDAHFIDANARLPQCTGVAVGFDRLMMLRHHNQSIHPTMALIDK